MWVNTCIWIYIYIYIYTYIYETERTKVEVYALSSYNIDRLNLSDFKRNLIADSNKLQFCWKLIFHWQIDLKYDQLIVIHKDSFPGSYVHVNGLAGYSRKKPNRGGGGLRLWNFEGYWRNSKWIYQVLANNKTHGLSRGDWEKIMWIFHRGLS